MEEERKYLPPEWEDDIRIRTLMNPMPQDEVARNARLTFWKASLDAWCKVTNTLTFTLQDCMSAFRRGTQEPLCLADVLLHMNSLSEVIPLDELPLGEKDTESWVGWGSRVFIGNPSRFAWKKVKQALGVNNIQGRVFVNTKLLQDMCDRVLKSHWKSTYGTSGCSALTFSSLYANQGDCVGNADNLHLVVESLAHNGRASTIIHNDKTYVKFAAPGDTQRPVITEIELAENELHCAQERVEDNISKLDAEISHLHQEVMTALNAKAKNKALSLLRRKKRAEKSLETQMGALGNITTCLQQIQETQVNKQVLGAFRSGVEAMRNAVSGDQSADNAVSTMDELQQVLDECQDISSALGSGVTVQGVEVEDDTLLEELNQIISTDDSSLDQSLAERMKGLELPDVPKSNPLSQINEGDGPLFSPH